MVWGLSRLVLASVRAPALVLPALGILAAREHQTTVHLSPFCRVESVDCPTNPSFTIVVET